LKFVARVLYISIVGFTSNSYINVSTSDGKQYAFATFT